MKHHNPTFEELSDWKPAVCFYWSDVVKLSQFGIWKPYMKRSAQRIIIWSDSKEVTPKSILDTSFENIVFLDQEYPRADVKRIESLKVFLYVTHKKKNFMNLDRFPKAKHVHINHGESVKGSNSIPEFILYDFLIWANKDAVKRFSKVFQPIVEMKSLYMGVPFLEPQVEDLPADKESFSGATILYQPTWEGWRESNNYTSIDEIGTMISDFVNNGCGGYRLLFRPHPAIGKRIPGHKEIVRLLRDTAFRDSSAKYWDYEVSDFAISDVSGASAEYLSTKKLLIVPFMQKHAINGYTPKSLGAELPFAYIWDISSEQLSDAIASAANDIELKSNREHEFTRYYSGFESINESAKHFDQVLQQVTTKKSFRIPSFVRSRILKLLSIK